MATKNIVPRADGEGQIGTTLKAWLKGYFKQLFVAGDFQSKGPFHDVRQYASFAAAVIAIDSAETTLLIPNQQVIAADVTVPATMTLLFTRGGSLSVCTPKVVTINGQINAGLHQIFEGTGTFIIGGRAAKEVYPEWWGGAGDNSTNNTAPIAKAIAALVSGGVIYFHRGTYLADSITVGTSAADGIIFRGTTWYDTILEITTNAGITLGGTPYTGHPYGTVFEEMQIDGTYATLPFLFSLQNTGSVMFKRIRHTDCGAGTGSKVYNLDLAMATKFLDVVMGGSIESDHGIYISDDSDATVIDRCIIKGNGANHSSQGIRIEGTGGHAITSIRNSIIGNWGWGIVIAYDTTTWGVAVDENYFEGDYYGDIAIGHIGSAAYGKSISVKGNYAFGTIATSDYFIYLQASDGVSIEENTSVYHKTRMIQVDAPNTNFNIERNLPTLGESYISLVAGAKGRYVDSSGRVIDNRPQAKGVWIATADGDLTPSVISGDLFYVANSVAKTVTNFDDGFEGQTITLLFADVNTTIDHSICYLLGGVNFVSTVGTTLSLIKKGSAWYEVARSVNV